jgi:hypothetical protein
MISDNPNLFVAVACNHPNFLVLPFRLELIRFAAWAARLNSSSLRPSRLPDDSGKVEADVNPSAGSERCGAVDQYAG